MGLAAAAGLATTTARGTTSPATAGGRLAAATTARGTTSSPTAGGRLTSATAARGDDRCLGLAAVVGGTTSVVWSMFLALFGRMTVVGDGSRRRWEDDTPAGSWRTTVVAIVSAAWAAPAAVDVAVGSLRHVHGTGSFPSRGYSPSRPRALRRGICRCRSSRTVVAIGRAGIGRVVIVAKRAHRRGSAANDNGDLCARRGWSDGQAGEQAARIEHPVEIPCIR